ncbi:hypothetical protein QOT17_020805 [Balamuthia mandrillaris]
MQFALPVIALFVWSRCLAYHQAHFDGLCSHLPEQGLPLPTAVAKPILRPRERAGKTKCVAKLLLSLVLSLRLPRTLPCGTPKAFWSYTNLSFTKPPSFLSPSGTTRNYIQYYNGTVVPADAGPTYTQQTKYWVIDHYIDTFCIIQNGACAGSVSTYYTFLERFTGPWVLHVPTAQGCATSNDAVLGNMDATGVETSPYNWAVSH